MDIEISNLGKCIRDIRKASGLSAEELGALSNITRNNITRFETGRIKNPSFDTVYKLISAICELDIIKTGEFDLSDYDDEISKLIKSFKMIPSSEKQYKIKSSSKELQAIYDNINYISTREIDSINFYIKSRKYIQKSINSALIFKNTIDSLNKDKMVNSIEEFKYSNFLNYISTSNFDSKEDELLFNELFSNALTYLDQDSLFVLFSYWLEFMAKMLPKAVDEINKDK